MTLDEMRKELYKRGGSYSGFYSKFVLWQLWFERSLIDDPEERAEWRQELSAMRGTLGQ